ncbi:MULTISPECIES: sporulation peptidase YabG [Paenibacillus]|uniref:Sporulation peptidase YabG n=2 Tax=Paenibacillus TaxID=44249 RepID=A0A1V4HDI7_9BACL|nr:MULTISPECIES: sporulation peptidase YabG [Paenibacillus]MEC0228872.1 sporulation peptidase YabG [Paenibacillus alba]NQX70557.1 sporulation peptidase YabG [Paenibacillus alba]OPH51256.1 sporulation peptidase YabG [Paenibacillus ferrarius]
MRQGDFVTRKSYGGDVMFRIERIEQLKAVLRGVDYRLLADAPLVDLTITNPTEAMDHPRSSSPEFRESLRRLAESQMQLQEKNQISITNKQKTNMSYFEVPGKVLHLDGDPTYLRKSMQIYGELRIPAEGYYIPESQMAEALHRLLPQIKPDIVVITGHDGILKHRKSRGPNNLSSYKNSQNFVNAVQIARQYERNRDSLIIVAGACQSHFEALLRAGANFASSPARILIHALDPLCIAAKLSYTSVRETISMLDIVDLTVTGLEGLGGVETRGSYRMGIPGIQHSEEHV